MSRGSRLSRRTLLLAVPAGAALAALAACAPRGGRVAPRRIVGIGFEDLAEGRTGDLAARLDEVAATDVSIVAGRIDWTAFPWAGREDSWSSAVEDAGGADLVGDAIAALGTAADGTARSVVLVVDVLAPGRLADEPALAGTSVTGERSEEFPSLAALTAGPVADDLVALVEEIARRYAPAAVSLTELFVDDTTWGDDDLADFRATTGADDWPRTGDGAIDVADEAVVTWRCEAIARLVGRCREAAAAHGVEVWTEVRSPEGDASGDRRDSGQDYGLLAEAADRIVVWDYFGIADEGVPPPTAELARALADRFGDRAILSVGLWDSDDDAIRPRELADAVRDAADGGADAVWVTPASLMTDAHWRDLAGAWTA